MDSSAIGSFLSTYFMLMHTIRINRTGNSSLLHMFRLPDDVLELEFISSEVVVAMVGSGCPDTPLLKNNINYINYSTKNKFEILQVLNIISKTETTYLLICYCSWWSTRTYVCNIKFWHKWSPEKNDAFFVVSSM